MAGNCKFGGIMNKEELAKYKGITGYSLGNIEKDYFQHIMLASISRKAAGLLVFKGGTALQKTGVIQRFSEDLDFTAKKLADIKKIIELSMIAIKTYNYQVEIDKIIKKDISDSFRLKIKGPLYNNQRGICTIRIEISKREEIILPVQQKELAPLYSDILPYILDIMSYEEILSEKIRAIYTRNKARDLYDLYYLLKQNTSINIKIINKKLSYYDLSFDTVSFLEKCKNLEKIWDNELKSLMEKTISFNETFSYVKETIKMVSNNK